MNLRDLQKRLAERLAAPDWPERKKVVKARAGGECQLCPARFPWPYTSLEVHHRHYRRLWREKDSDLTALCNSCHVWFELGRQGGFVLNPSVSEMLGIIERAKLTVAELKEIGSREWQVLAAQVYELADKVEQPRRYVRRDGRRRVVGHRRRP